MGVRLRVAASVGRGSGIAGRLRGRLEPPYVILVGMDCIFCKIVAGEIPAKKLYEDDRTVAFADINPKAPVHVLVIPKRHVTSLAELGADAQDEALAGHLQMVAARLAREQKLAGGYRVVINTGPDGGQEVDHLHLHLLGGRAMHWPPG